MLWAELIPQMRSWQPISKKMPRFLNAHVLRQLHHNSPVYLCWKILVRPTGEPNGQDVSSGWFWPTKLFIVWSSQIKKSNNSNSKANSKLNMHALNNLQTWVLCYLAAYVCFSNLPLTVSLQKTVNPWRRIPWIFGPPCPPPPARFSQRMLQNQQHQSCQSLTVTHCGIAAAQHKEIMKSAQQLQVYLVFEPP
jgi:hypothetical protein